MSDTTLPAEVLANDELMEAFLKEIDPSLEPGSLKPRTIIHQGDAEQPMPQAVTSVTSAGYIEMWDTRTGEKSKTNRNMLPVQLRKKRSDGSLMFTIRDPHITPKRGTCKCLLHPDRPERAMFDTMGFVVCTKSDIPSEREVEDGHMAKKHQSEWKTIQRMREEARRDREWTLQQAILQLAATNAQKQPVEPEAVQAST